MRFSSAEDSNTVMTLFRAHQPLSYTLIRMKPQV